jgi:hypothetical protein
MTHWPYVGAAALTQYWPKGQGSQVPVADLLVPGGHGTVDQNIIKKKQII